MRRMNPPSEHIRKAEDLEKYLRPDTLARFYGAIALLWLAIISAAFVGLVLMSVLQPTAETVVTAALLGCVPALFAMVGYSRRPNDPLSRYVNGRAEAWRRPLDVPGDECIFKTGLRAGDDMLLVKVAFHYPARFQTLEIKERLCAYSQAALTSEFSMKYALPSFSEVERALGPSMEMLAGEFKIPVFYPEILDVRKMRVLYDIAELRAVADYVESLEEDYLATGTAGWLA